jgi:hypothetical protein
MTNCRTTKCPLKKICDRHITKKSRKGEQYRQFRWDEETGCYFFQIKDGAEPTKYQLKKIDINIKTLTR